MFSNIKYGKKVLEDTNFIENYLSLYPNSIIEYLKAIKYFFQPMGLKPDMRYEILRIIDKFYAKNNNPKYDLQNIFHEGNFSTEELIYFSILDKRFAKILIELNPNNIKYVSVDNEDIIVLAISKGLLMSDEIIKQNPNLLTSSLILDLMVSQRLITEIQKNKIESLLYNSIDVQESSVYNYSVYRLITTGALDIILQNTKYTEDELARYAFSSPNFNYLINIALEGKINNFNEFYNNILPLFPYETNYVLGIDFYLQMAKNYSMYEELLTDINEYIKSGNELTENQLYNLSLLFKSDKHFENISLNNINNVFEIMIEEFNRQLEDKTIDKREVLCKFITGYSYEEFLQYLNKLGNETVFNDIYENAKTDELKELAFELYAEIKFCYDIFMSTDDETRLYEIGKNLVNNHMEELLEIKSNFASYRTRIRYLFEAEANENLTQIHNVFKVDSNGEIIYNEEYLPEGATVDLSREVPIINLQNSEYTLYAHVTGFSPSDLLNIHNASPYHHICISPISDIYNGLFSGKGATTVGFSHIPLGNYIGSGIKDLWSWMAKITYDDSLYEHSYEHYAIRETTKKTLERTKNNPTQYNKYPETNVFRDGTYPSCVIHRDGGDIYAEIQYAQELSRVISQKMSEELGYDVSIVIPIVMVQSEGTTSQISQEN